MQSINDWELNYLMGVDCYEFIGALSTKHFFYDIISKDFIRDNSGSIVSIRSDYNEGMFNNVSVIFIYTCIANIINDSLFGCLNKRHSHFKRPSNKKDFNRIVIDCKIQNYIPDNASQVYAFRIGYISKHQYWDNSIDNCVHIKAVSNNVYEHEINILSDNNNVLTTFVLMYQDFIDNIPLKAL